MKLLHTADLHFGKRWRGASLLSDQISVLDEILDLCEQHDVDMLLIAGDVFADSVPGNRPVEIAQQLLSRLLPVLEDGRTVFLLRGNHDSFRLFELLSFILTQLAGKNSLPLVVASRPGIYPLPKHDLQVIAVPYLASTLLKNEVSPSGTTPGEELAGLAGLFSASVHRLCKEASPRIPAIFTAHVMIDHAELRPDVEVEEGYLRELVLHTSDLPQITSYNALGHIHLGQQVRATGKPTWYSGAPDRLDLGERDYRPQVLLVSTPDAPGGEATVQPIPISGCTTWVKQQLQGVAGVESFCEDVAGIDPIGEVVVADVPPSHWPAMEARVRSAAPRVAIRWAGNIVQDSQLAITGPDPSDVYGTVRAYLETIFEHDTTRRDRLITAFDDLWSRANEVSA